MKNNTIGNKKDHVVRIIIMFLLVLTFGSVLSLILPSVMLESCILVLCFLFKKGSWRFPKKAFTVFFVLCLFSILSALFTSTAPHYYLSLLFRVAVVFIVCSFFDYKVEDIEHYLNLAFSIVAILALINFVLYTIFPDLFTLYISQTGFQFKTFVFLFNCGEFSTLSFMRNQGVFWEPGVLQIILNLLLIHVVFSDQKVWRIALLCGLIATTASTTGLLLMTLILVFRLFKKGDKKGMIKKIALVSLFSLLLLPFVISNVQNKVSGDSRGSSAYRTYDLIMGFQIIKNHPIWGIGLDFDKYQNENSDVNIGVYNDVDISFERGNTNTIVSVAVFCGIPFAIFFLLGIYHQRIFKQRLLFFIVFVVSLFSEPLFIVSFTFLIVFSRYVLPVQKSIEYEKSVGDNTVLQTR